MRLAGSADNGPHVTRFTSNTAHWCCAVCRDGIHNRRRGGPVNRRRRGSVTKPIVRFAFARYEAAITFEKTNTATLTQIMAGYATDRHLTSAERTEIIDNWLNQ